MKATTTTAAALAALAVAWAATAPGRTQVPVPVPGVPALPKAAPAGGGEAGKEKAKTKEAATTVATTAGPIKVEDAVDDHAIETTLEALLPQYPGVISVDATVKEGVVALDGQVDDDDTRDQMTAVAQKVEGVRLVINRLATDEEVMTAPNLVLRKLSGIWDLVSRRWLLALLAVVIVVVFSWLARLVNAYAERLLAPFLGNMMLRSVVGSLLSTALVLGGVIFGLSMLNLTHVVASVLGLATLVGLAVGFAFKDITENFIASLLLGVRRPFRVGDYVTVAGQTGLVKSLNTRATVLVTLEGNHVRIPNNVVYKEILINATASPTYRASFDVVIPYEASTAAAVEAMTRALRAVDGLVHDPPARALVEALEPAGVRVRAYYWVPVQGVDWFLLNSDAKLAVKVALQKAGVLGSPAPATPAPSVAPAPNSTDAAALAARAEANLKRDAAAAASARAVPAAGHPTPVEHALEAAETHVSEEGTNLLVNGKT
jgi:small-conductance mechanosensitive channel